MNAQPEHIVMNVKTEPREVFCKDFDLSCFEIRNATQCKLGHSAVIHEIRYYTLPLKGVCPMCDRL